VATGCDRWRSARAAGGRVQASGKYDGEARRRPFGKERTSVWAQLTRWRTRNARRAAPRREALGVGYSIDPHSDGNERADSRIQVLQPDGTMLRPGPPDIHPLREMEEPVRRATSPAK
jgi:hypothetical protein